MTRLAFLPVALVCTSVALPCRAEATPDETPAPQPSSASWGEASVNVTERMEYLSIGGAEVGKSGLARGPGVELRFVLPMGWGAYYRWTDSATSNGDRFEWEHSEYMAGVSRRLLRVGRGQLWAPRVQATFDLGVGWSRIGTHESCTRSFVPWGTDCFTGPSRPQNVQGDALSFEARVGAGISFGPLTVGADVGASAHVTVDGGDNSWAPPPWFFAPSGQLRLGLALPY